MGKARAREEGRKQDTCSSLHIAHRPLPFWEDGCPADSCILQAFSPMGGVPGRKVLVLIAQFLDC